MEILNTIDTPRSWLIDIIGIACILVMFGGWIPFIYLLSNKKIKEALGVLLLITVCTSGLTLLNKYGHPFIKEHEVVLTDSNYVIDATKYKIVGQRGKIITIDEISQ